MPSFANTTLWLYRRIFGARPLFKPDTLGVEVALDGNSAVAVVEASIAETAALGASFPADSAELAWRSEEKRVTTNIFGDPLSSHGTDTPRSALAAALGLALSGSRSTVFLSGPDLATAQDLLRIAAGRHLPLVIHLSNRALVSNSGGLGSGHEAYHLSADSGCFVLAAANVQEAVDFSLIARRTAELTLTPALVAMDGEQTALAVQDVSLPTPELVQDYLGSARENIPVPTPAQKLLFGEQRRRVPRWYDLDDPVLLGSVQGPESYALGAAAQQVYFDPNVSQLLEESFQRYATHTGRLYSPVSTHHTEDARLLLVVQGAAIETAEATAEYLRKTRKLKVGVLGIRCLRPFPADLIANAVRKKHVVAVLERVNGPLASEPPLLREVRASINRALEIGRFGKTSETDYPAISANEQPQLRSIIYGLGGFPLRGADLIKLCTELDKLVHRTVYLGMDFTASTSDYPKRQAVLDGLRRGKPQIVDLGLRSNDPPPDLRPVGAVTVAVHRISGQGGEGLAVEAGAFIKQLKQGSLRTQPGLFQERWGFYCVDKFTHADNALRDPGDDVAIDVDVVATPLPQIVIPLTHRRSSGTILFESPLSDEAIWQDLAPDRKAAPALRKLKLYCLPPYEQAAAPAIQSDTSPDHAEATTADQKAPTSTQPATASQDTQKLAKEYLLGGMLRVLVDQGVLDIKARRVLSAREEGFRGLNESQRSALLEAFNTGFHNARRVTYHANAPSIQQQDVEAPQDAAPLALRDLGHRDDSYSSLPRFWDHIGVLYRDGVTDALTADPYMTVGAVPALSSNFRPTSNSLMTLPTLDPLLCTGCGECWGRCPDSAIGAVAITPDALIDSGIRLAAADALRQVSSKLAARFSSLLKQAEPAPTKVGEILDNAFAWVLERMPFPEERKRSIQSAHAALLNKIGGLPIALTEPFFFEPEQHNKGSGELLSLVINADACKGCGLCIAGCEPQALAAVNRDAAQTEQAHALWNLWTQLPGTPATTRARISSDSAVPPMAALLLDPSHLLNLTGGDGAEAGSGEKLAVRLTLAVVDQQQRIGFDRYLNQVQDSQKQVTKLIRKTLANALPTEDLDALSKGLNDLHSRQIDLAELTNRADLAIEAGQVDATRLRRLVELAKGLVDLRWRLAEGPLKIGRAHVGLAVTAGSTASWVGAFPYNSFRSPVTLDLTGEAVQLAAGLLQGQLREATQEFVRVRKARLEIEHPLGAERERAKLERLSWRDLDEDERRACPSILVIGTDAELGGKGFSQVTWMLGSDLPIKILVLADLDLGLDVSTSSDASISPLRHPRVNLGLAALANRQAYVAQTTIADSSHLLTSVQAAFAHPGPALIHVHAPSPQRHGFSSRDTLKQADLAVKSRVFPLFRYDPQGDGVFGSRLNLDGNPQPDQMLVRGDDGERLTTVHWAFNEQRFSHYFTPLRDDDPSPLPIEDYLELETPARVRKTPVVNVADHRGAKQQFKLDPVLVRVADERLHAWRTLQELAGLVTPFTARVHKEAREKVAKAHTAEIEAIKESYEDRIRNLQEEARNETAVRIRSRLLALAGYESTHETQQ